MRIEMDHPYFERLTIVEQYRKLHDEGIELSRTPPNPWRRDRFYNLLSALELTLPLEGEIAECGSWRGLSSFLICSQLRLHDKSFTGAGYHVFDSFEGLSEPTEEDSFSRLAKRGVFAADLAYVQETLRDFPGVSYHKGWVPDVFREQPDRRYRFVHVDLDLAKPTVGAMSYFMPRIVPGGALICDDYGSHHWTGTRDLVDKFVSENNVPVLRLSTGQILLCEKG